MAKGKKYYWIKLKDSFLTSDKVDYLLSQKNGANYVVIYQMLCLKTINNDGEMMARIGEIIIPYNVEKIQRDLKHFDIDTIRVALELYKNLGMIYEQENGVLKITDFKELIGCETDYALQKRNQRQLVDKGVDNVHIEKEIDIRDKDIDINNNNTRTKHKYGQYNNVLLTDDEYSKLKDEYSNVNDLIKYLDEYIEMKGYKAKSHYLCIKKWVVDAVKERRIKQPIRPTYDEMDF